jgi:hypothetical protein
MGCIPQVDLDSTLNLSALQPNSLSGSHQFRQRTSLTTDFLYVVVGQQK